VYWPEKMPGVYLEVLLIVGAMTSYLFLFPIALISFFSTADSF
jgi:hypothetical protein